MMKLKSYSKIAKRCAGSIAVLGFAFGSSVAFAAPERTKDRNPDVKQPAPQHVHTHRDSKGFERSERIQRDDSTKTWDLGRGWNLTSMGGLSFEHPNDSRYWFKLSGVMRFDETLFMGNYRDKSLINGVGFANGANVRAAEMYFDGGVGEFWEYTLTLRYMGYVGGHGLVAIGDAWIAYSGFCENNQLFIGRVPGNWFGLDNSNSTSWNPFLERSLPSLAFYPDDGLGVMTDFWNEWGGLTLTAAQRDLQDSNLPPFVPTADIVFDLLPQVREVRDRWRLTARATFSPVHAVGDVWHFGISGAWRETQSTLNGVPIAIVAFSARPSARARNTTTPLSTGRILSVNNVRWINVEMARECGPLLLEGEYTEVFVHRHNSPYGSLRFDGWNVQARYLLTGEVHEYDVRDGAFGTVDPLSEYGAFEVAARYDFLNLNSKDIRGGTEHNATLGLNWFYNKNVRLSANYIRADIHPRNDGFRRKLDIVGMRCQVRFK